MSDIDALVTVSCEDFKKSYNNFKLLEESYESKLKECLEILKKIPRKGIINRIFKRTAYDDYCGAFSDYWVEAAFEEAGMEYFELEKSTIWVVSWRKTKLNSAIKSSDTDTFLASPDIAEFVTLYRDSNVKRHGLETANE